MATQNPSKRFKAPEVVGIKGKRRRRGDGKLTIIVGGRDGRGHGVPWSVVKRRRVVARRVSRAEVGRRVDQDVPRSRLG